MQIAPNLPKLTVAEFDRCWMTPPDVCGISVVGDADHPDVRRFLNSLSDRGLLPCEKSGTGRTSSRRYPCAAAVRLRAFRELTASGRPYEKAAPVVDHITTLARHLIEECRTLEELNEGPDWFVVYETGWGGEARAIRTVRGAAVGPTEFSGAFDHSVFAAGELIWNILLHYAEEWRRERVRLGLDRPAGRYDGCDDKGFPLDPAHPSNRDLPPLEYAKRLLEIEEYIARKERRRQERDKHKGP